MDLEACEEAVRSWASGKPKVNRLWFYGSRVKGRHSSNSDLDIAIEIASDFSPHIHDPSSFGRATFINEKTNWVAGLQALIPCEVDIKLYEPTNDCRVRKGVEDASILVYEKLEPGR